MPTNGLTNGHYYASDDDYQSADDYQDERPDEPTEGDPNEGRPSDEELEAESERREALGELNPNYLDWLAHVQLEKEDPADIAARQKARADFLASFDDEKVGKAEKPKAKKAKPAPVDLTKAIDAADLMDLSLRPLRWIVPDLVPEGTTLLAAPPKIGKSSLMYQLCVEIACGGELLGRKVAQGSVLYLALEDSPRRGQAKLAAALNGRKMPKGRMTVWWNAPRIGEGLEERLYEWAREVDDPILAGIDTLERVRPESDGRKASAYRIDVAHISALQEPFRDTDTGLALVHHARKEASTDHVQSVSGTYGLTGSVDTNVGIERKRSEMYALLKADGRDVGYIELPAKFEHGLWTYAPEAVAATSDERVEMFKLVAARGPLWPKDIAKILGKNTEAGRIAVQKMLTRMVADKQLIKGRDGYSVPMGVPIQSTDERPH